MLIVLPNTCHHLCYLTFIQCQLFNELEHRFVIRRGGGMGLWALSTLGSWDERWYFIHPFLHCSQGFFFFFSLIFLWSWKFEEFFPQIIEKLVEFIVEKKFQKLLNFFHPENYQNFPPKKPLSLLAPHFFPTSVAYAVGPRVNTPKW
jgi:hypothetical protein